MNDDEIVKLYFEADTSSLEKADKTVAVTTQDVYKLADTEKIYEQRQQEAAAATAVREAKLEKLRMTTEDYIRTLIRTAEQEQAGAAGAGKLAGALGGGGVGRAALEASRALEDLQYGVGGVVNNIPGLAMAFGAGGIVTAGLSLTAIGVNQLVKHWGDLQNLFRETHEVPKAADALQRLNDELKKNTDQLDEFKKKTALSNEEFDQFNKLTARNVELEKQKTAEMEKQARLKKLGELKDTDTEAAGKERAGMLQESLGGQQEELVHALAQHMNEANETERAIVDHAITMLTEKVNSTVGEEQKFFLDQLKYERARGAKIPTTASRMPEARDIVAKAVVGGDLNAFRKLEEAAGMSPEMFSDQQRAAIENASPESIEAEHNLDVQHEQFLHNQEEKRKKRAEANRKRSKELAGEDIEEEESNEHAEVYFKEQKNKDKDTVKRQIEQENREVEGGGYVHGATATLAQLQAMGGTWDAAHGRVKPMTQDQMFNEVARRTFNQMMLDNPGRKINPDVAGMVAARAQKNLAQQMAGLTASGFNTTEKLTAIGAEQLQMYRQLAVQQRRVDQRVNQLERRVKSSARTHLNSGGGAGPGVQ